MLKTSEPVQIGGGHAGGDGVGGLEGDERRRRGGRGLRHRRPLQPHRLHRVSGRLPGCCKTCQIVSSIPRVKIFNPEKWTVDIVEGLS